MKSLVKTAFRKSRAKNRIKKLLELVKYLTKYIADINSINYNLSNNKYMVNIY